MRCHHSVGAAYLDSTLSRPEVILTPLLNVLNEHLQDFVLALDGYHVIEANAIHAALALLLDHLPPHMHNEENRRDI